jgi:hypothetical protein
MGFLLLCEHPQELDQRANEVLTLTASMTKIALSVQGRGTRGSDPRQ